MSSRSVAKAITYADLDEGERIDLWLRSIANDLTWMGNVVRTRAAWPSPGEQVEILSRGALTALAHLAEELGRPLPIPMYESHRKAPVCPASDG